MKIIILIDSATVPAGDSFFLKKTKNPSTEYYVIQTIRKLGFPLTIIPVENSLKSLENQLKKEKPNLVFNLTEEFRGERRKDVIITALLSKLKIPFTGSNSIGLSLCRNKILSKQILAGHKINVPDYIVFAKNKQIRIPRKTYFPLVVKPAFEDGSDGISNASIVNNIKALKKRVRFVTKKWKQPAIAEDFIPGREFYVGIIGNKNPAPLLIRECIFKNSKGGPKIATYRVKWNEKYRRKWNVKFGFAKLDNKTTEKINKISLKAYKLLHLRGYGRIDLRLTPAGKIVILEVNANPDVAKGEDLALAADKAGISYKKFIEKIISGAKRGENINQ